MENIAIVYRFSHRDGTRVEYDMEIDAGTLVLASPVPATGPDWARLSFHQCPDCPLDPETTEWCPLALQLADIRPMFEDLVSWQEMEVEVVTAQRRISTNTTAQKAIGAMMGLLMPVSGCPRTAWLRPMARFHLPFASEEETIYRACSMYLLAQYFLRQWEAEAGDGLDELDELYQRLQQINRHIAARLRDGISGDSMINAVVVLDTLARTLPWAIEDSVEELRHLFGPYLEG